MNGYYSFGSDDLSQNLLVLHDLAMNDVEFDIKKYQKRIDLLVTSRDFNALLSENEKALFQITKHQWRADELQRELDLIKSHKAYKLFIQPQKSLTMKFQIIERLLLQATIIIKKLRLIAMLSVAILIIVKIDLVTQWAQLPVSDMNRAHLILIIAAAIYLSKKR